MVNQFLQLNGKILIDKNGLPLRAETPDIIRSEFEPSDADASKYADGTIWIKIQNGKPVKSWVKDSYAISDDFACFFAYGFLDGESPIFPITKDSLEAAFPNTVLHSEFGSAIRNFQNLIPEEAFLNPELTECGFDIVANNILNGLDTSISCQATEYDAYFDSSKLNENPQTNSRCSAISGFFNFSDLDALKYCNGSELLSGNWDNNEVVWGIYINPNPTGAPQLCNPLIFHEKSIITLTDFCENFTLTATPTDVQGFTLNEKNKVYMLNIDDLKFFLAVALGGDTWENAINLAVDLRNNVGFESFLNLIGNDARFFIAPFGYYKTNKTAHLWRG